MSRFEIDPEDEPVDDAPPRRWSFKMTLLAVAVVGVAGGLWWGYRVETSFEAPSQVPVIRPNSQPVKEAPRNPGGMVVSNQDSLLLNREGENNAKIEQLLPPPPPILPRPAPPPSTAAEPSAPPPAQAAAAPARAAPAPPSTSAPSALPPAPRSSPSRQNPRQTAPPLPAAAPAKKIVPPTAPQPALGAGYRLQLGALRSEAAAAQAWQRLKRAQPDVLGRLNAAISQVDIAGKGVFYRLQVGPIADRARAEQSCAILRSRHVGCFIVQP